MAFSHGDAALDLNAVFIVNDAVQNTFSDGAVFIFGLVAVNAIILVVYVILGTEDQRSSPATGIDQFQKIIGFRFGKRTEKLLVNDQQVKPGIGLFDLVLCIQAFGNRVFIQQIRHMDVVDFIELPACGNTKCVCDIRFSRTRCPLQDYVVVVTDICTGCKIYDKPFIQLTVFIVFNRFPTCLVFTEPGLMDPALDGVLPAGNAFCIYKKRRRFSKESAL